MAILGRSLSHGKIVRNQPCRLEKSGRTSPNSFATREPQELLTRLEFALRKPIQSGRSLLFLDEIHLCPEALI